MQPPFPCPVATWHNDTYDSISPSRSELNVAGKTVVIVGGGSGIGQETALAFVTAGAAQVALVGRTDTTLQETAKLISSAGGKASFHVADITKAEMLNSAATAIGTWHVLVICSGYCPDPSAIPKSDEGEWWKGFETNVNGTFLTARAFLPTADATNAAILGVTSDTSLMPVAYLPGLSSYISSKLAQAKLYEFLAVENPDIFIATVNPGMIDTDNFRRTGGTPESLPMDKVQLAAHFLVWMASPEAAFLRGRCTWANWDVEELKSQKSSISEGLFMTAGFKGLPKI